jgi:hypothetical protein
MPWPLMAKIALAGIGAETAAGVLNANAISDANSGNMELTYDLAKHGIQYRVEDALASNINPLVALGANTHSPSIPLQANTGLGNSLSAIGGQFHQYGNILANQPDREMQQLEKDLIAAQIFDLSGASEDALFVRKLQNNPNLPMFGQYVWWPSEAAQNAEGGIPAGMAIFGNGQEMSDYITEKAQQGLSPLEIAKSFIGLFGPNGEASGILNENGRKWLDKAHKFVKDWIQQGKDFVQEKGWFTEEIKEQPKRYTGKVKR